MAYRAHFFTGLVKAHFVPKRNWSCIRKLCIKNTDELHEVRGFPSPANVHIFMRSFGTTPCIVSSNFSELLSIDLNQAKVLSQFARPMSQFSRGHTDIERMQQALQRSSEQQTADAGPSRLIYRIRGLGMMRICTLFFYATSLTGAYMAPDLISGILEHNSFNSEMLLNVATIAMATVIMPILLTMFNRRLVLRLYYNDAQKSYVAMTQTPMLTVRKMEFSHDDIIPNKNTGTVIALFNLKTLKAKGRPFFFNPYNFTVPSDFNRLMGYEQI